jgi:glycosyltransferase involved in cell wall biosynthesis
VPAPAQHEVAETAAPLVSVVIATHNRPAALRQAIKSVQGQTFEDWEIIVVGDACRPDTPAVVLEFDDRRISYIELPINFGEQSGPNNLGMARSRGRYIALLNHDDLWFPDHLAALTAWLEASGADVAFSRGAVVLPRQSAEQDFEFVIHGRGKRGRYDPAMTTAYASTWLLRRWALEKVGWWRPAVECFAESSQDWLWRAWRRGLVLAAMPHLTVLMPQSGMRDGSYANNQAEEQITLLGAIQDDPEVLRRRLLERATEPKGFGPVRYWKRRFYAACGIDPRARSFRRKYRRGSLIQGLRLKRGLTAMPQRDPDIDGLREFYRSKAEPAESTRD